MLKAQSGVAGPGRDEDREFRLGVVVAVALDRSPPAQSLAVKVLTWLEMAKIYIVGFFGLLYSWVYFP